MRGYRHCCGFTRLAAIFVILTIVSSSCSVYTVSRTDLENRLKPKHCHSCSGKEHGLNALSKIYKKQYVNTMDTLQCVDAIGHLKIKRFSYDSKITIITNTNRTIRFYAKTLFIWKDQFLIGERTSLSFYGPNYFPVKLSEIARIEVKKPWL